MSDLRKAAEMALETLEITWATEGNFFDNQDKITSSVKALRQALAQPEQEPDWGEIAKSQLEAAKTALNRTLEDATVDAVHKLWNELQEPAAWQDPQYKTLIEPHKAHPDWIPLYTAPPKREWVVLTDEEIKQIELSLRQYNSQDTYDLSLKYFAKAIEAKSKEKNT